MTDIGAWWEAAETFEKVYWVIAIPSSIVFVGLTIMAFVGGDIDDAGSADADIEADDGIGFQFLTLKNLIAFFTVFAWSGLVCINMELSKTTTLIVSIVSGIGMMAVMASIFYLMGKLTDSGTLNMKNAISGIGEVYLLIKGKRGGMGKVQITIQGSLRELEALTDDEEDIPTGAVVEVTDVINNQILLVRKFSS